MPHRILVIDDQIGREGPHRREFLAAVGAAGVRSGPQGCEFEFHDGTDGAGLNSVSAVLDAVRAGWPDSATSRRWSLVLLDVRFGEDADFGFTLLRALREDAVLGNDLPVVMLTSEDPQKRSRAGEWRADGFLPKFDEATRRPLLSPEALQRQVLACGLIEDDRPEPERLVGRSLPFLKVLRECRAFALNPVGTRILYGETGTGKTELATYIHRHSRPQGPFVAWFADPANRELMKDEIFGHWKGAHSEAKTHQPGKIESAHGGSFFLDEVANLPVELQQALLKFRKEDARGWRSLARLGKFPADNAEAVRALRTVAEGARLDGDTHDIAVDVLFLTGTKEDLESEAVRRERGFLHDLHNALGTPIRCPRLNDRREDVQELFTGFVTRALLRAGGAMRERARGFSIADGVHAILRRRDWSKRGNVRDLERIAQHAAVQLRDFDVIYEHCLPSDVLEDDTAQRPFSAPLPAELVPQPVAPQPTASTITAPAPPMASVPGELAAREVAWMRQRAELLESFAELTRKPDKATGLAGRYQPAVAASRMLGHEVSPLAAKRLIGNILKDILDTPDYLAPAYLQQGLGELREWLSRRPVLLQFYAYATGRISAAEIGAEKIGRSDDRSA